MRQPKNLRTYRDSVSSLSYRKCLIFPHTNQLLPTCWCYLGLWHYRRFPSLCSSTAHSDRPSWHDLFPIETFYLSGDTTTQQSPLHMALSASAEGEKCPGAGASPLSTCRSWRDAPGAKSRLGADQRSSLCGRLYSAHALTRSHKITNNSAVNCSQ